MGDGLGSFACVIGVSYGQTPDRDLMKQCSARAILVITRSVKDTATDIARERLELFCGLAQGHAGLHHDVERDEHWEATDHKPTTVLRHEDEPAD